MKPTYEHDEAKRLRTLYNQLLSYKDDFVLKVMVQKLTHEQRLEAGIEVIKLTGEIKRLDWFIGHLLFGWEKGQENDGLSIFDVAGESYRLEIEECQQEIEKLKSAVRRLYRTKTSEEGLNMNNRIKRSAIIKELNIF